MSRSRRWHALVAALLVLLQALFPAVHGWQHARAQWPAGHAQLGSLCHRHCHCHGNPASRDRDVIRTTTAYAEDACAHEGCALCEQLRGSREFHGASALVAIACATGSGPLSPCRDATPLLAPRPLPFGARAPPTLVV